MFSVLSTSLRRQHADFGPRSKKRGKRRADSAADAPAGKKKKDEDEGLTEYQKEVRRLEARNLQDSGYGQRALLK